MEKEEKIIEELVESVRALSNRCDELSLINKGLVELQRELHERVEDIECFLDVIAEGCFVVGGTNEDGDGSSALSDDEIRSLIDLEDKDVGNEKV